MKTTFNNIGGGVILCIVCYMTYVVTTSYFSWSEGRNIIPNEQITQAIESFHVKFQNYPYNGNNYLAIPTRIVPNICTNVVNYETMLKCLSATQIIDEKTFTDWSKITNVRYHVSDEGNKYLLLLPTEE